METTTINLIELLVWYRDLIKESGREEANKEMYKACPKELRFYIEGSINDDGKFINYKNEELKVEP